MERVVTTKDGLPSAGLNAPSPGEVSTQAWDDSTSEDLELIAAARGWTMDEATAYQVGEQAVDDLIARLGGESDLVVGSELSLDPRGIPTIYLKGSVTHTVRSAVSEAPIPVRVVDGQPYSRDELDNRQSSVHRAYLERGFEQIVTLSDIREGTITVIVPAARLTEAERIASLPNVERVGPIKIVPRDGPIVTPAGAFGGMRLLGSLNCTSGFTVRNTTTNARGINGAGHCLGVTSIDHPGHGVHPVTFQKEHRGEWGDVEWYTTPELEADDFYADAWTIRDVASVEPHGSISMNESICVYGRSTNSRNCTMSVRNPSIACGQLNRLVQMNAASSRAATAAALGSSG